MTEQQELCIRCFCCRQHCRCGESGYSHGAFGQCQHQLYGLGPCKGAHARALRNRYDEKTDRWSEGCPGSLDCLGCAECSPVPKTRGPRTVQAPSLRDGRLPVCVDPKPINRDTSHTPDLPVHLL